MSLTIRHVTPGLGALPMDITTEACSGLVGAALGIAQAQAEQGHRTQLLGWNPRLETSSWTIGPVEAYVTHGWSWAKLGAYDFRVTAPLLALAARQSTADILHAYTDPHLLLSAKATTRLFHLQTPVPERPSRSYSRLVKRADAVVCCSGFIRDQFLERVDYPESRVYVVTNGVDQRRFETVHGTRLRRDWGISVDIPVILFAGALTPEKGLLYLIQAASQLRAQHPFHMVVAGSAGLWLLPGHGSDSGEDEYTQMVREAAEGLPVTWLGSVAATEMPSVYAAADIFVCPSAWDEPFGMVACEAMAAGKPIVASRRGGLPEIVADGETGLLVPSQDVTALRSALEQLLMNRDLSARMGRQARQRSQLFSWSRIAAQLSDIYQELGCPPGVQASHVSSTHAR